LRPKQPGRLALIVAYCAAAGLMAAVPLTTAQDPARPAVLAVTIVFFAASTGALAKLLLDTKDQSARAEATRATIDIATELQLFIGTLQELADLLGRAASSSGPRQQSLLDGLEAAIVNAAHGLYGKPGLRAVIYRCEGDVLRPGDIAPGWGHTIPPTLYRESERGAAAFELLRRGEPVVVPDAAKASLAEVDLRPRDQFNAYARIPVVAQDRPFGILWVDGRDVDSLSSASTQALVVLARLLGAGLAMSGRPDDDSPASAMPAAP
jgi:GAF domain-containing protein